MNFIDKLLTKPLMNNKGHKIYIIELDHEYKEITKSLKRVHYILGEPLNFILTPFTIKKMYKNKNINNCPYI